MPKYRFPTIEERKKLIEQLEELERNNDDNLNENELYQNFANAIREMDREMEKLSTPEVNPDDPASGLVPPDLKNEDKDNLLRLISEAGKAGETFLAEMERQKKNLEKGIPGMVNRIQGVMARDFDAISRYKENQELTLPEIQEKARTKTIDFRGESLAKLGNMQNSRILMSVLDSNGDVKKGVFTKVTHNHIKSDFYKLIERAKEKSSPEGQEELDRFLHSYNNYLIARQAHKRNGAVITDTVDDDYLIGYLRKEIDHKYPDGLSSSKLKTFCKKSLKMDVDKISSASFKILANDLTNFIDDVGVEINNFNLELKEGDRLDNRNTCLSTIAEVLGVPEIIARSENMNYIDENGNAVEGTFMEFAKGLDLNRNKELFAHVSNKPFKKKGSLIKQLSDLQIVDFLGLNVDRHNGNMMYQVDQEGNIIGIQGIDNDSSFGIREIAPRDINKLRVVSKSMAENLEKLTPEMLKFALRGKGLSENELNKTAERLDILKTSIKQKKIAVVDDKDMGRLSFESLKSPAKNAPNLFEKTEEFVKDNLIKVRGYGFGLGFVPLDHEPEPPALKAISATERKGTVAGVEDTLRKLTAFALKNESDIVTKARGKSEQFGELLEAVADTMKEFAMLYKNKDIDKRAMLTEIDGMDAVKGSKAAFDKLITKADAYLAYKMDEKGVSSLEKLKGKNKYEQKHIDYAKQMLKYANEFKAHLAGPKTDLEKQEAMVNSEKRDFQMKKAYAKEIRRNAKKNNPDNGRKSMRNHK